MASPLFHFSYNVLKPLADTWQVMKVMHRFPHLEPHIKAFQKLYPYTGATTTVSVDEREAKGIRDDSLTYGETRWTTFLELLDAVKLQPGDRFIDLGCGAGFLCLLASQGYGVPTTGVDLIEGFIANANKLVADQNLKNLDYRCQDFLTLDLTPYTVFYTTATCFPPELRQRLAERLRPVRSGSKILSVTYPLEGSWLRPVKKIRCRYSWGMDTVYLCERV